VAYNSQTENKKNKLRTEYESVIQEVSFGNAVLAALMSGSKYVISQSSDCAYCSFSKQRTQYGKDPPADNAIRRWLKQFQETGSVLHRKGTGRPSTSQEDVDRIQEEFSRSPQKSNRRASLHLGIPQTTVRRIVHNRLQVIKLSELHFYMP
jgi:hypothetical protein